MRAAAEPAAAAPANTATLTPLRGVLTGTTGGSFTHLSVVVVNGDSVIAGMGDAGSVVTGGQQHLNVCDN